MSQLQSVLVESQIDVNHEGQRCWKHSLRDRVRNFLRTGTLSGTFYVAAPQLARETIDTLVAFGREDAAALADETVAARKDGYMRTLPLVATAVLSGLPDKELFARVARHVLLVPRDIAQFIEICLSGAIPGVQSFGGCRVIAVRERLEGLSEYHAVKGASSKTVALRDAVRLAHPRPSDEAKRELLGWLSGRVPGDRVTLNRQVAALEALKHTSDPSAQVQAIREGRLPFEAVTAAVQRPSREVWVELLHQAPMFNLLRNLVTFTRHGIFEDQANVEVAVAKLSRPGALAASRILPFQAYTAWKTYSEQDAADPRIIAALSDAPRVCRESAALRRKGSNRAGRLRVDAELLHEQAKHHVGCRSGWDFRGGPAPAVSQRDRPALPARSGSRGAQSSRLRVVQRAEDCSSRRRRYFTGGPSGDAPAPRRRGRSVRRHHGQRGMGVGSRLRLGDGVPGCVAQVQGPSRSGGKGCARHRCS